MRTTVLSRARRGAAVTAAALLAAGGLAACGSSTSSSSSTSPSAASSAAASPAASAALTITDPWVKATDTEMTGAFGVLSNPGSTDVTVASASTPGAAKVELHETVMKDGQMVMQARQGGFVVPAGGEVVLEPGGNHIMLMELTAPIEPGAEVPITLTLGNGQTVSFTAVAKDYTGANESYQPSPSASMS